MNTLSGDGHSLPVRVKMPIRHVIILSGLRPLVRQHLRQRERHQRLVQQVPRGPRLAGQPAGIISVPPCPTSEGRSHQRQRW